MSITRQTTLWCDISTCVEWYQSDSGPTKTRAEAKRAGWSRVMVGETKRDCQWADLCPACAKAR